MLAASHYRVSFIAREALDLPAYLGSTLRGAFGHAFRAIACPAPHGACPIPSQCPYHLIFETSPPPNSEALRTHEEIPRPFVIAPALTAVHTRRSAAEASTLVERSETSKRVREVRCSQGVCDVRIAEMTGQPGRQQFNPGDELSFELVLIGRAQEFFPYFVVALREVDRIGRGRRTVELHHIEALPAVSGAARIVYDAADNLVRGAADSITLEQCGTLPLPEDGLTIEFLTQTRLKHEGRFIRHPVFQVVFRRLLGRLSSLARFHCGAPMDIDFRYLIEQAASIRMVRDETKWTRWQRYSARQERRMEWEGVIGRARYEGEFTPFWKFLKFGELVHLGHGATFGLGKYRIGAAQPAQSEMASY